MDMSLTLLLVMGLTQLLAESSDKFPLKIGFLLEETDEILSGSAMEFETLANSLNTTATTIIFPPYSQRSLTMKAMELENGDMDIIIGRTMSQNAYQIHRIFHRKESVQQNILSNVNTGGMHWYLNLLSVSSMCNEVTEFLIAADCWATSSMAGILSQMILQMAWPRLSLVYHSSYAMPASFLVDILSSKGVRVQQYEIGDMMVGPLLQKALNTSYYAMRQEGATYVLFGDQRFIEYTLLELNEFDKRHGNLTVMGLTSKWVIWGKGLDDGKILTALHNINNAALLQQVSCNQDIYTSLPTRELPGKILLDVERTLREANAVTFCNLSTVRHRSTYNLFTSLQNTLSCHSCLQNHEFHVSTAVWTKHGRRLQSVTKVTDEKGVNVTSAFLFPNTQYGFNGMTLRVGTLTWPTFVMKTIVDGKPEYSGICNDLLLEFSKNMNFSYQIIEPEDREWGRIIDGNWTGLIAQLVRREVDIVVAPISIQTEREDVMDFISPYYHEYTVIMMKKPDENKTKWKKLIDPFHWIVIVVIVLTLPFATFFLTLCERVSPCYTDFEYRRKYPGLHQFGDCFWYLLGALLTQGGVYLPMSQSSRTIVSFWWLFSTIVVATYSGNLIASLTVTRDNVPFKNIEEMVSQTTYKWGTINGTYMNMLLSSSKDPAYQKIWEGIQRFEAEDPDVLNPNHSVQITKVKQGNYAYLNDASSMNLEMKTDCTLALADEEFLPMQYAVGLPQDSPYKDMFSEQMMAIGESGLLEIWKRKWTPRNNSCVGLLIRQSKPMSLSDVQSAYYLLLIGIVVAALVVIYEFLRKSSRRR